MADEPVLRSVPSPRRRELPLVEDPAHPGTFVIRRAGSLTLVLLGVLVVVAWVAGSLVRVSVLVEGSVRSMRLGDFLARELGGWTFPGGQGP